MRRLVDFGTSAIACAIGCLGPIGAQADPPPTMGAVKSQASRQVDIPPIILDACKIEYSGGLVLGTTGKLDVEFISESSVVAGPRCRRVFSRHRHQT